MDKAFEYAVLVVFVINRIGPELCSAKLSPIDNPFIECGYCLLNS